uniref:Uncharacterized protein n=1 Tax=Mus musculus TaxID=10090 RepID=Q6R5D7_MOUSE|nr:unknown [Mus musculus]
MDMMGRFGETDDSPSTALVVFHIAARGQRFPFPHPHCHQAGHWLCRGGTQELQSPDLLVSLLVLPPLF